MISRYVRKQSDESNNVFYTDPYIKFLTSSYFDLKRFSRNPYTLLQTIICQFSQELQYTDRYSFSSGLIRIFFSNGICIQVYYEKENKICVFFIYQLKKENPVLITEKYRRNGQLNIKKL